MLLLFLLDLRTAFISFISIPLSLLAAVLVLDWWGVSLNTMTLGGFAVALGVVVDDAIIDVENILRRLRENAGLAAPRPLWRVVLEASLEVNSAVVYATFIVAVVFIPVLTMTRPAGALLCAARRGLHPLDPRLAGVALTGHARLFASRCCGAMRCIASRLDWLARKRSTANGCSFSPRRPLLTAAGALALVLGACALVPLFGGELMPEFREGHFVIGLKARAGTSLEESAALGKLLSARMLPMSTSPRWKQQIGRAEAGEDTFGPEPERVSRGAEARHHAGGRSRDADLAAADARGFPGVQSEVLTFLGDRIGETISGETASVVVNVFGEDLAQLDAVAHKVVGRAGDGARECGRAGEGRTRRAGAFPCGCGPSG